MHSHNSGYQRLFSNRTRFRDLVQTFVEVDRFMAVWVGHYLLSFCLDYRSGAASVKLQPQIFPIVLYNGSDRWTAPLH